MNLYEINAAIMELVDTETGELLDYDAFLALQMEREIKIENTALWIKNLNAEAKMIKAEEDSLHARRKAAENKATRLKEYLSQALDGDTFHTPKVVVSYRTSSALEIEDPSAAEDWLNKNGYVDLVVYDAPKLDKRGITEIIKGGVAVPGAELVKRTSIQLR